MYTDDEVGYIGDNEYDEELSYDTEEIQSDNSSKKSRKKMIIIIAILTIILLILLFVSCQNKESFPSIDILSKEEKIRISESVDLNIYLQNNSHNKVDWKIENENVATIDNNGIVTGIAVGKTKALAVYKHNDNKEYSDDCNILVYRGEIGSELIDFNFDKNELKLVVGEEEKIGLEFNPSDAYVDSILYTSSNSSIVTVDNNGVVTANSIGKATIKVVVNNLYQKNLLVFVSATNENNNGGNNSNENNSKPTSIKFNDNSLKIAVNQELMLQYTVLPTTAKNYKVSFENSNNTFLRIDKNGKMKGLSVGKSKVTVIINDIKASIEVEVIPHIVYVDSINITSSKDLNLSINQTSLITYNVIPEYASNKTVTFSSTDSKVAEVDVNGLIKAVGKGTCVITIKTVDGNKIENINVTVN